MSRADIKRVIRGRYGTIKNCYERALKDNPTLSVNITLHLQNGSSGKVLQAGYKKTSIEAQAVGECIAELAKRWRFPETTSESVTTINYPFIFRPAK